MLSNFQKRKVIKLFNQKLNQIGEIEASDFQVVVKLKPHFLQVAQPPVTDPLENQEIFDHLYTNALVCTLNKISSYHKRIFKSNDSLAKENMYFDRY